MHKYLTAHKCKDGWLVYLQESFVVETKTDVRNIIRHEGLKVKKQFSNDKKIMAE